MTKKRWLIAGASLALVLGLVVLALSLGDSDPRGRTPLAAGSDSSSESGDDNGGPRTNDDATEHPSGSTSDRGRTDEHGRDTDDSSSGGSSNSGSSPGRGKRGPVTADDRDGDGILDSVDDVVDEVENAVDDVTDTVEEVLCSVEERAAIDAKVDDLTDDILAEADAAKDDLLDSLGLGGLLGGITNAIQQQLDAIDAAAEDQLAELESKADDAVSICQAGGNGLIAFV